MKCRTIVKAIFLIPLLLLPFRSMETGVSRTILNKMLEAVAGIKTLRYELESTERIEERALSSGSAIKIHFRPRKIYFKSILKGIEVLYVENTNGNNALINPNRFPRISLNLDPYKSLMRHRQHHTIFELGFNHIGQITRKAMEKYQQDFERHFFYLGTVEHEGKICDKIYAEFPGFRYQNYTVKKGESIRSIALKFAIGEYRIYENNKGIKYHQDLPAGKVIRIPSDYGSKIILHIERESHLPLYVSAFDDKGLYESYTIKNLKVNPEIAEEEFDRNYRDYRF